MSNRDAQLAATAARAKAVSDASETRLTEYVTNGLGGSAELAEAAVLAMNALVMPSMGVGLVTKGLVALAKAQARTELMSVAYVDALENAIRTEAAQTKAALKGC